MVSLSRGVGRTGPQCFKLVRIAGGTQRMQVLVECTQALCKQGAQGQQAYPMGRSGLKVFKIHRGRLRGQLQASVQVHNAIIFYFFGMGKLDSGLYFKVLSRYNARLTE